MINVTYKEDKIIILRGGDHVFNRYSRTIPVTDGLDLNHFYYRTNHSGGITFEILEPQTNVTNCRIVCKSHKIMIRHADYESYSKNLELVQAKADSIKELMASGFGVPDIISFAQL